MTRPPQTGEQPDIYRCKTCPFQSEDPELAGAHLLENHKQKRKPRDSQRHQLEVLRGRDSSAEPCPVCGGSVYNSPDLKLHLLKEHGSNPDTLIDTLLQIRNSNFQVVALARALNSQLSSLARRVCRNSRPQPGG